MGLLIPEYGYGGLMDMSNLLPETVKRYAMFNLIVFNNQRRCKCE